MQNHCCILFLKVPKNGDLRDANSNYKTVNLGDRNLVGFN